MPVTPRHNVASIGANLSRSAVEWEPPSLVQPADATLLRDKQRESVPLALPSRNNSEEEPSSSVAAIYLALNFVAAISCIFVNRRLLKPPVSFRLPITLTLVGYASSVVGLQACKALGLLKRTPADNSATSSRQTKKKGHLPQHTKLFVVSVNGAAHYVKDGRVVGGAAAAAQQPTTTTARRWLAAAAAAAAVACLVPSLVARGFLGLRHLCSAHRLRHWVAAQPWFLICTTAGAPLLANYSLLLNSVGVYQLSKVLVTPSIIFFERLAGAPALSTRRYACLALVSVGVGVVTWGDMDLNTPGLAVATLNILVAGYYKVAWSHMCRTQHLSSLELMERVMPQATLVLVGFAAIAEGQKIASYPFEASTFALLLGCGVTAFLTSWSGYVVIAKLSALTHQLLGQAKTCLILLAGSLVLHSPLTHTQGLGATLAMSAMVAYTRFSIRDKVQQQTKEKRRIRIKNEETPLGRASENGDDDGGGGGGGGGCSGDSDGEASGVAMPARPPHTRTSPIRHGGGGGARRRRGEDASPAAFMSSNPPVAVIV